MTERLYTSTIVLCRLLCEPAGEGMVLLRVPGGVKWLADRVCQDWSQPVLRGRDWLVVSHPDAVRAARGIEWVPEGVLRTDALGLADLMVRSIVSGGSRVRPLRLREFEMLDRALGHCVPEWRPYVPVEDRHEQR
jgi:hypothetical protein